MVTCLEESTGVSPVDMALVGEFKSASNAEEYSVVLGHVCENILRHHIWGNAHPGDLRQALMDAFRVSTTIE